MPPPSLGRLGGAGNVDVFMSTVHECVRPSVRHIVYTISMVCIAMSMVCIGGFSPNLRRLYILKQKWT